MRTYQLTVCSTFTHLYEAWTLTAAVIRSINGFNRRCLPVITGQDYRHTATAPLFDLLRAIRQRRLRYLGHILRMTENRVVRRALMALTGTGTHYAEGSLLVDCQTIPFPDNCAAARCREPYVESTAIDEQFPLLPLDAVGQIWMPYIERVSTGCRFKWRWNTSPLVSLLRLNKARFILLTPSVSD